MRAPVIGAVSRRGLIGAGVGAAGLGAVGVGTGVAIAHGRDAQQITFHGEHQAGIVTPAQDRLYFASFDLQTSDRDEVVALLQRWTGAAELMTQGLPLGDDDQTVAPPADTGEVLDLSAANLTITFGFGPGFFTRLGLEDRKPALLTRLPHFPADQLDPAKSDGDLCVQACSDDPQVAVHAVRNLSRLAFGQAAMRWSQLGFGRTSSTSTTQKTARNLFGFKDGTANLKAEDAHDIDDHVWVAAGDDPRAGWLAGGSYLVARRIVMSIESWDRTPSGEQEALIGRDRTEGAPLSGGGEFTQPDFSARKPDGSPVMAMDSHVRLAHPSQNKDAKMLRRGYNFADGNDALGRLTAGLFFLAYVRNPATQYIPMQNRLSRQDGLMEYLTHRGSALYAVPRGVRPGEYVGQALFEG
jgi:deferrochelatase/peroxidase EfeB